MALLLEEAPGSVRARQSNRTAGPQRQRARSQRIRQRVQL